MALNTKATTKASDEHTTVHSLVKGFAASIYIVYRKKIKARAQIFS